MSTSTHRTPSDKANARHSRFHCVFNKLKKKQRRKRKRERDRETDEKQYSI
jgi:hypothetical protein